MCFGAARRSAKEEVGRERQLGAHRRTQGGTQGGTQTHSDALRVQSGALSRTHLRQVGARRVELAHELPDLAQGLVVLGTHRPELVLEIVKSLRALLALLKPVPFLGAQLLRAIEGAIKGAIEGAIEGAIKGSN